MNYSEQTAALASTLEADGYHLAIEELDSRLSVTITAGPDACEDCLVPKDLMRGILSQQLGVDGESIDITYPVDLPGYTGSGGSH
ncbi:MAG TPA: hypothetical protein VH589_01100 [Trebonia sp.]|jgi:hypothetical protein